MDRIVYLIMEQTMTQEMAHFHLRKAGADPEIFYVRIPHIYSRMCSDWPEELWSFLRPFVVAGESLDVGTVYDQTVDNWLPKGGCPWMVGKTLAPSCFHGVSEGKVWEAPAPKRMEGA